MNKNQTSGELTVDTVDTICLCFWLIFMIYRLISKYFVWIKALKAEILAAHNF